MTSAIFISDDLVGSIKKRFGGAKTSDIVLYYDIVLAENLSFPCIQFLESLIYFCSKKKPEFTLMGKKIGVIAASKIWHLPSLALHDLVFYITALFCHWDAHLGLFSGDFITTFEKSRGPEGTTGKLLSIILSNFFCSDIDS